MKKCFSSSIILTAILCHSFLLVRAPFNNQFRRLDQLEKGIQQVAPDLEGDHLEKQGFRSSSISTPDEERDPEMTRYLMSIEKELMDDTDCHALDNDHPNDYTGSELTRFWSSSEDMKTILKPEAPRNDVDSLKSKRRRFIMTHPQELQAKTDDNNSKSVIDCERDKPYFFKSVSDPMMLHTSCHDGDHRHVKEVLGLGNIPRESQMTSHLEELVDNEWFIKETPKYLASQSKGLISLLKLKGDVALWHNLNISRQIENFFDRLTKHHYLSFSSSSSTHYSQDCINTAIERVRKDIVMAYFGGLSIVFQRHQEVSTEDLVASGWKYIKNELEKAFNIGQRKFSKPFPQSNNKDSQNLSTPFNFMEYMLKLEKKTCVQPSLIGFLIHSWATEGGSQSPQYKINLSNKSFLSAVAYEVDIREKKHQNSKHGILKGRISREILDFNSPKVPKISKAEMHGLKIKISRHSALCLAKIGRSLVTDHQYCLENVDIFFDNLEKKMKKTLEEATLLFDWSSEKPQFPEFIVYEPTMIQKAISVLKTYIMPAFIGTLFLLHPDQNTKEGLQMLLKTGWYVLQEYISRWGNLFSQDTSSIIMMKGPKVAKEIQWHNISDSISYLCSLSNNCHVSNGVVWFIYELWYDSILHKRVNWGEELVFEPSPPNRDLSRKMLLYFEKNGIEEWN